MMKGKVLFISVAVMLAAMFLSGFSAQADDIKSRMLQRLPVINSLKGQGIVGENNQGLLEYRKSAGTRQDVVNAENQDRRTVYRMIAERQKTTPELVGKHRAAQIAQREPAGHWLQDAAGRWYKK
ncbi:MAG: YdbL family protein [Desulfuromonadaceae bacterium]|nr:YdbL family protein [Desulfuromonadaceae bacterium]